MNYGSAKPPLPPFLGLSAAPQLHFVACTVWWECMVSFAREAVWSKVTITGGDANSSISVGEWVGGEGAGRRECWEQRQTSSIPELCAHIFLSLSSRVSSADAAAQRKGSLLFLLSLPVLPSLRPYAEGVGLFKWRVGLTMRLIPLTAAEDFFIARIHPRS